jgi:predicted transcriptional regulator
VKNNKLVPARQRAKEVKAEVPGSNTPAKPEEKQTIVMKQDQLNQSFKELSQRQDSLEERFNTFLDLHQKQIHEAYTEREMFMRLLKEIEYAVKCATRDVENNIIVTEKTQSRVEGVWRALNQYKQDQLEAQQFESVGCEEIDNSFFKSILPVVTVILTSAVVSAIVSYMLHSLP